MEDNAHVPPDDGLDAAPSSDEAFVDARIEKIQQHIENCMQLEDPLQACTGAAGGDLMKLQFRVSQQIDQMLQETPDGMATLNDLLPAINTVTKLSKQVERFNQLSCKLKAANADPSN